MQRCFSLRMGLDPFKENVLPPKLSVLYREGGAAGKIPSWREILDEYWRTRDWVNGVPRRRKLVELGLGDFAKEIYCY